MDSEEKNESWYELAFYRGLIQPSLLFGCPKPVIVLNGLFAIIMLEIFGFWPIIFFSYIFHQLAVYICKSDDYMWECFLAYWKSKSYYKA
jgi:type IV secretory pathway TrbD component